MNNKLHLNLKYTKIEFDKQMNCFFVLNCTTYLLFFQGQNVTHTNGDRSPRMHIIILRICSLNIVTIIYNVFC